MSNFQERALGRYRLQSLLGAGGMGEVYRALDTELGREVAVKVLPREFAEDPERVRRFEIEARAAAAISHPKTSAIFNVERSGGTIRLWPMPDLSKPPLHTLPRQELIAKLKSLTNLRVVRDEESPTGWKLTHDPFPG